MSSKSVQEVDVIGFVQERLMVVLAMQVHERVSQLAQRPSRGKHVIDERTAATLSRNLAADDDLAAIGPFEDGLDRPDVLARTNEVRTRSAADEKVDGFD